MDRIFLPFKKPRLSIWTRIRLFFKRSYIVIDPVYPFDPAIGDYTVRYKVLNGIIYIIDEDPK